MKKVVLSIALLFCVFFVSAQQRSIKVTCINKISFTETKYKNREIVEVVRTDLGYSALNQQLINFIVLKLQNLNFKVFTDETSTCDYELILDSVFSEIGYWNSTHMRLNDTKNNKHYDEFLRNGKVSSDSITGEMSAKIINTITENIKDEMFDIFFYNADVENGMYKCGSNEVPVRKSSVRASKIMATLSLNDTFSILEMDQTFERTDDIESFSIKIKTADGTEGWITSDCIKMKD